MVVDVLVAVLLGGTDKGLPIAEVLQVIVVVEVHIGSRGLGKDQLARPCSRVSVHEVELILKSIEADKCELVGVLGPVDSRQVLVFF